MNIWVISCFIPITCFFLTNKTDINIPVEVFVWTYAFISLGLAPHSEMIK